MLTRRTFVAALAGAFPWFGRLGIRLRADHPEPRPGIDAARVIPAAELTKHPDAAKVFDMVREIPHVVDGIRCQCGCGDNPERYSLLSCFEPPGMARRCEGCKAQARRVFALHKDGKTLAEIRTAIDDEFGH